ncbi:mandelate racemase/muconate lactonizing enzyme family protein (plasmid) [Kitasatospora sp. NBC_00070]|uniref:mandelate racemase/muconate lactonizing enzyme family protein n=1 Tax=Kitasatospora sp. NBC_00070 TaxID=2975962 RepID=UPI002F90CF25
MTTVSRIELYHVAYPLQSPFRPSWIPGYPQTENRFDLLRVITDDGIEGWSAGPALGRERGGLGELLSQYMIGLDATDIDLVQQRLREMSYLGLRNHWIEPAFWDIKAKLAGVPVYRLLGAEGGRIRLYASTGEVRSPQARVEEAEARYQEGFRAIKLRVHDFDESADLAQVEAVVAAVGDRMKVAVDANQAWRVTTIADAPLWDLARAKRFADACADLGVAWLEEPLPMDAYDDLAELTRHSRIPIAGGELHTGGLPELRMMIERRCYSYFQPDAVFTGGIAQTLEVIRLCRAAGLSYTPHTWTNGIGFAVNLQLMAVGGDRAHGLLEYPINPPSWTVPARDAILTTPWTHQGGELELPTAPGLGFDIDHQALRRHGTRFASAGKFSVAVKAIREKGFRTALEINKARRS